VEPEETATNTHATIQELFGTVSMSTEAFTLTLYECGYTCSKSRNRKCVTSPVVEEEAPFLNSQTVLKRETFGNGSRRGPESRTTKFVHDFPHSLQEDA
jgi:hypothetical protein